MTLIKWPGGKSSEIKEFKELIPEYSRYIEPFFGGGAVFFHEKPEKAIINDISENLMNFYSLVKEQNSEFHYWLVAYDIAFKEIYMNAKNSTTLLLKKFNKEELLSLEEVIAILSGDIMLEENEFIIDKDIDYTEEIKCFYKSQPHSGFPNNLIMNQNDFYETIHKSINSKLKRAQRNHNKKPMSVEDILKNLVTGFTSGYYTHFRNIYNDLQLDRMSEHKSLEYKIANFYWIREYCYGSMFRYNKSGEFNIPYGGISYNNKNFTNKINKIFSDTTQVLFENTEIYSLDFEELLSNIEITENDFMFLDPPYDTEFSAYEGKDFNQNDQVRLRNYLLTTPSNFILVIKNTEFIFELYNREEFIFANFDKSYTYNVRARNDRNVNHLIIMNSDIPIKKNLFNVLSVQQISSIK